jgi:hypothetical protein
MIRSMEGCIPMAQGKIQIQTLSMGIKIAPDVFQNVMSKLVQDMEYDKTYLDDLLILTNSSFKDHLLKLEMVLARLSTAGMRVNISKSKLTRPCHGIPDSFCQVLFGKIVIISINQERIMMMFQTELGLRQITQSSLLALELGLRYTAKR